MIVSQNYSRTADFDYRSLTIRLNAPTAYHPEHFARVLSQIFDRISNFVIENIVLMQDEIANFSLMAKNRNYV